MNEFKKEYENIKASEDLKKRVQHTIKKEKWRTGLKNTTISAAAILMIFITILNFIPSVAYGAMKIPVLNEVVKVLTFNRYESQDNGYQAIIETPKIEGLANKKTEQVLNDAMKAYTDSLISEFEAETEALKEEFGDETVHNGIESGYQVKTNSDNILSIELYVVNLVGTNSHRNYFTVDKNTGQILSLAGLFQKEADYVSVISEYLSTEMERQNEEEDAMFFPFEKIKPDQNFYIDKNNKLVICFDRHEVAAGAQGSPEITIPSEIIAHIIDTPNLK